ncbi:MAG TPA: type II secretion system protein [Phycisphaerae bacterium]|nr:type II secretion system protein [Phycisphaerae bacterium]HOJ74568.1 type II secretion system protein [Phycisphaerae bacterium]HON66815.1 type II secretion system protein [Phycisphaerae bacterium]HOQ87214.1 type II secretion system protein [Phycisphaerae bacterium]HPU25868.1 type II secretion system protein [Phycisphaerae bacterium]
MIKRDDTSRIRARADVSRSNAHGVGAASLPAFTLIEVLVVVAIIALLIGLLVPSLSAAREKTRLIVCQSNQRNVAMAWHAYLKDHQDRLPRGYLQGTTFGGKQGIPEEYKGPRILNRYVGIPPVTDNSSTAQVFSCPGDRGGWIPAYPDRVHSSHFDFYGTSYRSNRFVIGPVPPETSWYDPCQALIRTLRTRFDQLSLNVSTFSNESRLILFGDYGFTDWQNPDNSFDPVEFHARSYRRSSEIPYDPMYASRQNVAFVDGHVSFVEIRKGIHVCAAYTVIPFRDMQQAFAEDQKQGHFP